MAKKKKKYLIKLNNKIRNYFDGKPFDEGVVDLDEYKLVELTMLLELNLKSLDRDTIIRQLRRIWSENISQDREMIVSYLTQSYKSIHNTKTSLNSSVDKILYLLEDEICSLEEENLILESFVDTPLAKITKKKVINRLRYIRQKSRLANIEESLDIGFNSLNQIEFYNKFKFTLKDFDHNKILLCQSEPLDIDGVEDNELISNIELLKQDLIIKKQNEVDDFVQNIQNSNLSRDDIDEVIKKVSPDTPLWETSIEIDRIFKILELDDRYKLYENSDFFTIVKSKQATILDIEFHYSIEVSYGKPLFLSYIYGGEKPPISDDLYNVNIDLLAHFKESINELMLDMKEDSISLEEIDIESFVIKFIAPTIESSKSLVLKEKTKKRILYHFHEYIKPLILKQKRKELLAKSIRDFKMLFPLAREMNRKIVFNVGDTNSGKTYQAHEELKSADTGYYLAPLRLLALEGYENLKKDGINISLITGEEEIIDEDSTHIASTIEMMNSEIDVDVCVIDEIQMIDDRDRGWAWANALIGVPAKKVILTGSYNCLNTVIKLCEYLNEELEVIHFDRKNELLVMDEATNIDDISPQTAIIAFSRREVLSLKQRLSSKYNISVIYGNLSPEVRREEARRFREKESDILVATDAISMGLNLPIKTILFSRDNKFDGVSRRKLLPIEVIQISGRAGRYGYSEKGFVGALFDRDLKHIKKAFFSPLIDIELPISIRASYNHIMLIGEILQTKDILEILEFFAQNMEFDGPFIASNIDSMLEIASIVNPYDLDLKTKYYLSTSPATISSPYIEGLFHRYIRQIEKNDKVQYIPPRELPKVAQTNEMLLNAEDRVREISLYLWLSFKFPDLFEDIDEVIVARAKLNRFIENSLKNSTFSKPCRKCGKLLDWGYKFNVCDKCHNKNRVYKKRYLSQK